MNHLSLIQEKPKDPILGLAALFQQDPNPHKINLAIGIYKTEEGQVALFKSVHEAEQIIWNEKRSKDYAPIDGDNTFKETVMKLLYGEKSSKSHYCAHTTGCTAAVRITGELFKEMKIERVYLPDATWHNHHLIYTHCGLKTPTYPYFDSSKNRLRLAELLNTLKEAPEHSAVLFQVACHNPVGRDPTHEEWQQIVEVVHQKKLFPILDSAYQGFGHGFEEDFYPIRLFQSQVEQYFLCYSFSKNFGLYGERAGVFIAYDRTQKCLDILASNVKHFIRVCYSSPPIQGGRIIKTILQSSDLKRTWEEELYGMQKRLSSLRKEFVQKLKQQGIQKDYSYIEEDLGLFSLLGLSQNQVIELREKYGVYILENSRLNIAALSQKNMDAVAKSIKSVM